MKISNGIRSNSPVDAVCIYIIIWSNRSMELTVEIEVEVELLEVERVDTDSHTLRNNIAMVVVARLQS